MSVSIWPPGRSIAPAIVQSREHVAIGLLLDVWLLGKLLGGMTRYRRNALRAIALYWHGVNVLTLIVTLTVLSPSFS